MKRKRKWVLFLIVFPIASYGVSLLTGKDASLSCLAAIAVSGIGGAASLAIIGCLVLSGAKPTLISVLIGSFVRLLLIMSGSVTIIVFTQVNILWFVIWIMLFYAEILLIEIRLVVQFSNNTGENSKIEVKQE